jgi:hypothetical protein
MVGWKGRVVQRKEEHPSWVGVPPQLHPTPTPQRGSGGGDVIQVALARAPAPGAPAVRWTRARARAGAWPPLVAMALLRLYPPLPPKPKTNTARNRTCTISMCSSPRNPHLHDLHVQQPQESAPKAAAHRARHLRLERKCRVVELQAQQRLTEVCVVVRVCRGRVEWVGGCVCVVCVCV